MGEGITSISIDAEKSFNKVQRPLMTLKFFSDNQKRTFHQKPTASIVSGSETSASFFLK